MTSSQRRSVLVVCVLVAAALIIIQPIHSEARKSEVSLPLSIVKQATPQPPPAIPADTQVQVLPGQPDASLDVPPNAADAVVVDAHNPDWVTHYGTQLGRMLLPPRQPDQSLTPAGAIPPFAGFWLTTTIQAGTQGVAATAYAPDGRLFAALRGLGLRVYGPNVSGIYQWTSITASAGGLLSNNVTALAVFNNQLWIGTSGSGVSVYNLTSGTWISYTVANSPLPSDIINRFTPVIDPNGPDYIWVSTNSGGAAKFTPGRPGTWQIINTGNGLPSNIVYDIGVDPTAFLGTTTDTWFATDSGLVAWNGTTFTAETGGGTCTGWNYATRVIVDRQHRVWFTPIQIIPGRPAKGQQPSTVVLQPIGVCVWVWGFIFPSSWTLYNSSSPGLPSNAVTDLSEDFAGRIWMSTQGGGVVNDNNTWRFYTNPASPLLDNNLWSVLAVGEAVWWGHTSLDAFSMYSPNWLRYTSSQIGNVPTALYLEASRTWVGANAQIAYSDGGAWTTLGLSGNGSTVSSIARDGKGNLWVSTLGNGLYELNASNVVTDHITSAQGLPANTITALYADDLGRMWVGTNAGLAMRAEAGYWLTFSNSTSPLVSNLISSLAQDNNKRLWIGTDQGISIYDLNAFGNAAWKTQTQSTGVPSNTITGLVRDPVGTMWVATGSGVGAWNPISATWKVYSNTNGALPDNYATAITSDPSGRIWVTTHGGVALYASGAWRIFHVPATSIESNRPFAVSADNDRTWIEASNSLAVRGVITSPIGNAVPVISGFAPTVASPGATIVITGNNYDSRGPEFNTVTFPDQTGFPAIPTDIQAATSTALTVTVPALANSGKLQVKANDLKSLFSSTNFQLRPNISGLSASCVTIGQELKINGNGFVDGGTGAYVKIGNGPERYADASDPTQVRTFIRAGDTSGQVRIRLSNGQTALSSASVTVAGLALDQSEAQQGLEGETMIWGKRTLVLLQMHSTGCPGATIDYAQLDWKMSTGPVGYGGNGNVVNYPGGKTFGINPAPQSVNNSVSIMADQDLAFLADDLNLPSSSSSLQFFQGVTITLKNHFFPVMTIVLPKSKFNYIDTAGARRHFIFMEVTGLDAAHQSPNFDSLLMNNLQTTARIFPQQDASWFSLQYSWLHETPIWLSMPPVNFSAANGNSDDAIDAVDDYLDPGGDTWAVAAVDAANLLTTTYTGIGGFGERTVGDTNALNKGGYGFLHELMHAFNFVDDDAANYKNSSTPGEDNHSLYDEGQWTRNGNTFANCVSSATFQQALIDETGSDRRVVRLFGPEAPQEMLKAACTIAAGNAQSRTAKSLISYAPGRSNFSAFLEPLDYRTIIDLLCDPASRCPGYKGTPLNSPMVLQPQLNVADAVTRTLHLSGKIDLGGNVTTSLSYVAVNDGSVTPQQPLGQYHLIVRNAANAVLHDQVFDLEFDGTLPHADYINPSIALHPQTALTATIDRFNLRVPFPIGAVKAEIQHDGTLLWSNTVSTNTPTVNFIAPNGGTYNAANVITVTWTANDADSDPLQFGLDYSPDNGANWTLIAPKLLGNSYAWIPNFVPASNTARLRLRASDGFNVGMATSSQFTLTPRAPEAIILAPDNDSILTEGSILKLDGMSLTDDGPNLGTFTWKRGASTLGTTRTITTALNSIGLITFTLNVSKDSLTGSSVVSVTVVPDYDHDGLPNSWELLYKLNPLDPADALADSDGDGLTNLQEYQYGTDPTKADTDGDGYSDGAEIAAGTDPLNPASHPTATPVLHVGAQSLGFTVNNLNPLPDNKYTWVTNSGGGVLNWSVTKNVNWLSLSPLSGGAPTELIVGAIPFGLLTGTYTSHITVTAAGTAGSPQVITVTLQLDAVVPAKIYMPLVMK